MAALTNAADAAVEDEVELLGAALAGTEALLDRTIAQALEEADQDRAREQRVDEPSPAEKQPDEPPSQPSRALLHNVQASHDAAARHREDALQKAVAFRDRRAAESRPKHPRKNVTASRGRSSGAWPRRARRSWPARWLVPAGVRFHVAAMACWWPRHP